MKKVLTIHLDGIAYSVEEGAYEALRAYLDAAKATLSQNPDREEIIKDLEQAIGGKLTAYLNAHKNVVVQADVDAVLAEMGPVASEGEDSRGAETTEAEPVHKRLYRIPQGEWLAGVCTGLAAYFNMDVVLVRVLFVILISFTHGFGGLLYIAMALIVPVARTAKDYENATGVPPITAQDLVDRARKGITDFTSSEEWQNWRANWKSNKHAWKEQHKAWKRAQKQQWKYSQNNYQQSFLSQLNEFIWSMFGLLVAVFVLWFLYHHVQLIQQFFDFLRMSWISFIHMFKK